MGNTLDMAKIKEDHQARNERLMQASASAMAVAQHYTDETMLACYADMLTELALIWREEANRLSELPSPKPRGWKTTMDSLRDCATRVSGVAVAMRNHGLPGDDDSGPKARTPNPCDAPAEISTESPAPVAGAAQAAGEQLALVQPLQDGKSELQNDLRAVYRNHMSVESFRAKWPDRIPEDQMVEFLKTRKGDADPKDGSSQDSTASASLTTSLSASSLSNSTPAIDADVTGTQATPALVVQGAPPDFPAVDIARQHKRIIDIPGDPAGDFLRDLGRAPNAGDWTSIDGLSKLAPAPGGGLIVLNDPNPDEPLAEAAASIIEQVRAKDLLLPGEVFMNSGGALDTSPQPDQNTMTVTWRDGVKTTVGVIPQAGHEVIAPGAFGESGTVPLTLGIGGPVIGETQWSIGAADAPPAWAALPEVPRFELDSPMALDSPGHTSVSQANMVSECALKWKLAKRHGAPERPGWALVGGKAFHGCIEALELLARTTGTDLSLWAQPENVARLWEERFTSAIFETSNENPLFPINTWHASNKGKENRAWWDADGPEMVHRYLEWRAKWIADGWELLRTADGVPVVELEFLAFLGGSPVKGFIDSGWYHKGRNIIAVVDWKSGTSKPADWFQQATYRHALEPLLGWARPQGLVQWLGAFWDARSGELGPLIDLDVRHPKAEVEMRLSMPRRIDAAGLYMPNVNTGYGGCGSCSLKRSCPVGSRIGTGEVKL